MKLLRIFILFLCFLFLFNITFGELDKTVFQNLVYYVKDIKDELQKMNKNLERIAKAIENKK